MNQWRNNLIRKKGKLVDKVIRWIFFVRVSVLLPRVQHPSPPATGSRCFLRDGSGLQPRNRHGVIPPAEVEDERVVVPLFFFHFKWAGVPGGQGRLAQLVVAHVHELGCPEGFRDEMASP